MPRPHHRLSDGAEVVLDGSAAVSKARPAKRTTANTDQGFLMTDQRWRELMNDSNGKLTQEEMAEGWHWCPDWDDLLVGPGSMEITCCTCTNVDQGIKEASQWLRNVDGGLYD